MNEPPQKTFRRDLVVVETERAGKKHFFVEDPGTGDTFEFGEEEFYLCQLLNGRLTTNQILQAFEARFGMTMREEDLTPFYEQIASYGLLEASGRGRTALAVAAPPVPATTRRPSPYDPPPKKPYRYFFPQLEPVFGLLAKILSPFHLLFKFLSALLVLLVPLTVLTLALNPEALLRDFGSYLSPLEGVTKHFINMLTVNGLAKAAVAIVLSHYGIPARQFGLQFVFGFFPRFNVGREPIYRYLTRGEQLWTFATPLLIRLWIFSLGGLVWYANRGSGNHLAAWAASWCFLAFIDLVIDANPLVPGDAYGFATAYFRLPPSTYKRNLDIIWRIITFKGVPATLSFGSFLRVVGTALAIQVAWLALFTFITFESAKALFELVPALLGEGLGVILFCLPFVLALRWYFVVREKTGTSQNSAQNVNPDSGAITPTGQSALYGGSGMEIASGSDRFWNLFRKVIPWVLLFGFLIVLFLPYTYHFGGPIQLLPPRQEKITVEVAGILQQINFKGGDPQYIKKGTPLAVLKAIDTQKDLRTTQAEVRRQEAELAKAQDQLARLLNTPRPQEVDVARQGVAVAQKEVTVATSQLTTAESKAAYSEREAARILALYQDGATSFQAYEDARRQAETERIDVLTYQQQLESARQRLAKAESDLRLVQAGPYPQEVAAARKQVANETAELQRLNEQLKYYQQLQGYTRILMPFDGYLVTPNLNFKLGSRLNIGDVLAVAESSRNVVGTLQMPEYQVGQGGFKMGNEVEIKLWAYPNQSFKGKVVSIEPVATTLQDPNQLSRTSYGADPAVELQKTTRYVNVVVDVPNSEGVMKSGMTGYAKVKGDVQTVLQAYTHPIVRFFQVELWSWLP